MNTVIRFIKSEEGAALAEYALLLGLVTVTVATVIITLRDSIESLFTNADAALNK